MNPAFAVFGGFLVIATLALAIAGLYIGGGRTVVSRNASRLGILAIALVGVALFVPVVADRRGDMVWPVALVIANVVVVIGLLRQTRMRSELRTQATTRPWSRFFWVIVVAWGCLLAAGLAIFLVSAQVQ